MRQKIAVIAGLGVVVVVVGCSRASDISYSSFVNEIEVGNVSNVELSSERAVVTLKSLITDNSPERNVASDLVYRVTLPPSEHERRALLELLEKHSVPFQLVDK